MNYNVEVAEGTAPVGRISFAAEQKLRARINSGRNSYGDSTIAFNRADSAALIAWVLDNCTSPSAFPAWLYSRKLHKTSTLHVLDLPASPAIWASLRRGPWSCS